MRTPRVFIALAILLLLVPTAFAEEVTLPAPVLEWSFYILLIFAVFVVIGISIFMNFFKKSHDLFGSLGV